MNNLEFGLHFAQHLEVGLFYGFICVLLNLWVMRRYIYSIFDPLLFFAVLSAMGGSIVLYLQHFHLIQPFYFWSYIATQLAFTIGFLLIRPPTAVRSIISNKRPTWSGPIMAMYPISVVLFVVSQLAVYSVTGLPILLESRLEAFSSGGGFGLLSRVIFVTSIISFTCAVYRLAIFRHKCLRRTFDYTVLIFSIAVAIVSGSKGALLLLIFSASLAMFYARRFHGAPNAERRLQKYFIVLIVMAIPAAFFAVYLQAGIEDPIEIASVVGMRFFGTGDVYFMAYPNQVLHQLQNGNGLLALFYSPLGSMRIMPREDLPTNLGLQIFWYHYNTDLLSGPNARHNVFALLYFGPIFSVVFSFLLGFLYSVARNASYRHLPSTPVGLILYVLIAYCSSFIEQDVSGQSIDYFFSVVLIFPPLYAISSLVGFYSKQKSNRLKAPCVNNIATIQL